MSGCCGCLQQFSLWEQMLKAYKYMSEILSVTHTYKDPADGNRKLSKMDISHLEEQYFGMKQKQKLQTHIIVFKAGENELISRDSTLNIVPVTRRVQKTKPFKEQIPVKEVALELLDKNYLKDKHGPWHAHLSIHRMVQMDCHCNYDERTVEHKKGIDKSILFNRLLSSEQQPRKDSEDITGEIETCGMKKDDKSFNSLYRKSSLQHPIPTSWGHYQFPSSKPSSPTEKLFFYPFPQKKNPHISETARKLGLYVTH
ncbi:PREDICTED: uncharacterized protein C9orf152 homolog [Nanorana parkeri]|uniref:uncharacterized protein C9orf152 homolog n=1 Tax=Nanorana parkeri TaxID=125878 RepID=UPI00085475DD|nr:PREDICTED: uncharacterized protein C9orf152 homolog [Nanorana parkeri]